jgi:hypothetical protein
MMFVMHRAVNWLDVQKQVRHVEPHVVAEDVRNKVEHLFLKKKEFENRVVVVINRRRH